MSKVLDVRFDNIEYGNKELSLKDDGQQILQWILVFAIVTPILQKLFLWPLARKLIPYQEYKALVKATNEEAKGNLRSRKSKENKAESPCQRILKETHGKQWKFVIAATKLLNYLSFFAFSGWALQGQWYWFWDATLQHIPFKTIPPRIRMLYMMETAYYLYTLVAMYFEPKMKDRLQMTVHHLFTITLLTTSYSGGVLKYGTSIMILHDFSDPWMEAAKLANYLSLNSLANGLFLIFACSFLYLRVYIFPYHIIWATFDYCIPNGYPHYWITFCSLTGLWVLHCIWSVMIFKVFYNNAILGKAKGDVREEESDD